eukprot:1152275-Pelagomonas_calceolata.AAC.6
MGCCFCGLDKLNRLSEHYRWRRPCQGPFHHEQWAAQRSSTAQDSLICCMCTRARTRARAHTHTHTHTHIPKKENEKKRHQPKRLHALRKGFLTSKLGSHQRAPKPKLDSLPRRRPETELMGIWRLVCRAP